MTSAIANANKITSNDAQSVVDSAVTTLTTAVSTFQSAVIPPSDLTALTAEITISHLYLTNNSVGINPGQYSSQTAYNTLQIDYNIVNVYNKNTKQSTIDSATATLTSDVSALQASILQLVINPDTTQSLTIPAATLSSTDNNISVIIPPGTTITGDSSWNGTINPPALVPFPSVNFLGREWSITPGKAIEVGIPGVNLTFDKPVKIIIPEEAGEKVAYTTDGTTFKPITNVCTFGNNGDMNMTLSQGDACYYSNSTSGDLTIWTTHFTEFVTYNAGLSTQMSPPATGSGGSVGGGGGAAPAPTVNNTNATATTNGTNTTPANTNAQTAPITGAATQTTAPKTITGSAIETLTSPGGIIGIASLLIVIILAAIIIRARKKGKNQEIVDMAPPAQE